MADTKNLSGLSFFTVSKYHYQNSSVCDFRNSPRPHYCMGLLLEGEAVFEFDEKQISVKKGEIIFIPVGSRYRSLWKGNPDITYISMHFFFLTHQPFPGNRRLVIQKVSPLSEEEFDSDFKDALCSYSEEVSGLFKALSCFYSVMSKIIPRLQISGERKPDARIEQAVLYLEEHYTQSVTVDALAALSHMSVSHFHSCFKASVGMTPIEYRNHIRVRYAILQLMERKLSVEQIGEALGFESAGYFRRAFKKETGCSPTKYTQRHWQL